MKRTILGIFIMAIGISMCIAATTLFAVSAQDNNEKHNPSESGTLTIKENTENKVYTGDYYMDGDNTMPKITISEKTITFSDGTVTDYKFSVWKDIPQTNEATGRITYYDYCFLKTSNESMRYFPSEKEIEVEGRVYKLV